MLMKVNISKKPCKEIYAYIYMCVCVCVGRGGSCFKKKKKNQGVGKAPPVAVAETKGQSAAEDRRTQSI